MLARRAERVERIDNPIERLELLAGDDEAIASFLDQIAVTGPRDREMPRDHSRRFAIIAITLTRRRVGDPADRRRARLHELTAAALQSSSWEVFARRPGRDRLRQSKRRDDGGWGGHQPRLT